MRLIVTLLLSLIPWTATWAVGLEIYTKGELAGDKERYTQKLEFLLKKGLLDFMTPDERRALQGVVIMHPLRGNGPLTMKSAVVEGTPIVRAPVTSLKFIEDLSVAYAWRYTNRYSLEPMDEYLVFLKHRAEDFPGGRAPGPMTALGVPPKIWERDTEVDDLSLRFRNTAWAFILAHELGHLRLGHPKLTNPSPAEIQSQEEAADAFAVDLLSRSDTIPMGMILWFQATAGYMENRSDFANDTAYLEWLRKDATHPVNGSRMRKLATTMQRQAKAEGDPNRADVLQFIGVRLAAIGEIIEDPEMQQLLKRCAASRRLEDLKRLEDRPCR